MRNYPLCETAAVITCQQCGKAFSPKTKRSKFCSVKCYHKYYYRINAARLIAYSKKYKKDHSEKVKAYWRNWRKAHSEKLKEYSARQMEKRGAKVCYTKVCANPKCRKVFEAGRKNQEYCSIMCWKHVYYARPDVKKSRKEREHRRRLGLDPTRRREIQALKSMWQFESEERMASDPEYYAKIRAARRETKKRQRDKIRKRPYRPSISRRIPDYYCKGELVVDSNSQYLEVNLTDSQRAFARDLAIERKEYICKHNLM